MSNSMSNSTKQQFPEMEKRDKERKRSKMATWNVANDKQFTKLLMISDTKLLVTLAILRC